MIRSELDAVLMRYVDFYLADLGVISFDAEGLPEPGPSPVAWTGIPLAAAMRSCRLPRASMVDVTDAELAAVPPDREDELIARTLVESYRAVLSACAYRPDEQMGAEIKKYSQVRTAVEKLLATLTAAVLADYGDPTEVVGMISGPLPDYRGNDPFPPFPGIITPPWPYGGFGQY